jgi:hypothetical protein
LKEFKQYEKDAFTHLLSGQGTIQTTSCMGRA